MLLISRRSQKILAFVPCFDLVCAKTEVTILKKTAIVLKKLTKSIQELKVHSLLSADFGLHKEKTRKISFSLFKFHFYQ